MILNRKSCCIELPFFSGVGRLEEEGCSYKGRRICVCVCDFEFVGRRRSRGNIWLLVLPTLSLQIFKFGSLFLPKVDFSICVGPVMG